MNDEAINSVRLFYQRRDARLRQRLGEVEDLIEKYQILKAIHRNRKSEMDFGREDGGPGSGNFGHEGREGKVGGSAPEGSNVGGESHKPTAERKHPAVKSSKNFNDYVRENGLKKIYRGFSAPDDDTLSKYSEALKSGKTPDSGGASSAFGSGVYFADDENEAKGYMDRRKSETGDSAGTVVTCALDVDAKVMSMSELESAKAERLEALSKEIKAVRRTATDEELDALYDERDLLFNAKAADYGRIIGCDAMYDPASKYTVVINQNALVIKDDD